MKDYIEQLLKQIADELNIHEVILEADGVYAIYHYDMFVPNGKKPFKGFKDDGWQLASLWFTGDVLEDMKVIREAVKQGLKQRAETKIKVRQPLQSITLRK